MRYLVLNPERLPHLQQSIPAGHTLLFIPGTDGQEYEFAAGDLFDESDVQLSAEVINQLTRWGYLELLGVD